MATVIRTARDDDDAALQHIDVVTHSPDVGPGPPPPPPPEGRFFGASDRPQDVLIAEVDGAPAGYVGLGPAFGGLLSGAHVLMVRSLAVDPAFQRRGLGRLLLEAAIEEARRRGKRRLLLRVLGTNPGAQRLYTACGFTVAGVLPELFLLQGRYVDDVLMTRVL